MGMTSVVPLGANVWPFQDSQPLQLYSRAFYFPIYFQYESLGFVPNSGLAFWCLPPAQKLKQHKEYTVALSRGRTSFEVLTPFLGSFCPQGQVGALTAAVKKKEAINAQLMQRKTDVEWQLMSLISEVLQNSA